MAVANACHAIFSMVIDDAEAVRELALALALVLLAMIASPPMHGVRDPTRSKR